MKIQTPNLFGHIITIEITSKLQEKEQKETPTKQEVIHQNQMTFDLGGAK